MKKFKYILSIFIIAISLCNAITIPTSAATIWPTLSSSSYCEMISPGKIPVYRNTALTIRGTLEPTRSYNAYIEANDKLYIYLITENYAVVNYPTNSGRRTGVVKTTTLFGRPSPAEVLTSKTKITTYTTSSTSSKKGYIASGDTVFKLGSTKSGYVLVMYTAVSGSRTYKAAFVTKNDYQKLLSSSNTTSSVSTNTGNSSFCNGSYVRIRYAANNRYLDVPAESINENGAQLQVWDSAPSNVNQYFQLVDTGNGWQIISLHSGKIVEVRNSSHDDCAQVAQWSKHSLACGRWKIISNTDGTFSFQNYESKLYLNVAGGGNAGNGVKLIQYHNDNTIAMKFYIEPISASVSPSFTDSSGVKYTFKTINLDTSSLTNWIKSFTNAQYAIAGDIISQTIDLTSKMKIVEPLYGPTITGSSPTKTTIIDAPARITLKLHQHERDMGYGRSFRYANGSIITMYTCNCGHSKELLTWEIPLPDPSEFAVKQITETIKMQAQTSSPLY